MIRKDKHKFKYGTRTQIRVVEGYRPYPGGPVRQKTIKNFGYLEDQENQEAFMKMVIEYNENYKKSKQIKAIRKTNIPWHAKPSSDE
mgnify:CR=1 FL=1